MKIYDRGGVAWTRIDGVRKSLGVPFKDKKAHAAAIQRLLAAPKASVGVTLRHACDEALRLHYVGDIGRNQQAPAKVDEICAHFGGDRALASITPKDIAEWKHELAAKGNSGKTINRKVAVLSKVFHLAQEWGLIEALPRMKREKEEHGRVVWLTPEVERQVLDAAYGTIWQRVISVLIDTGMRPSEFRRVRPEHIEGTSLRVWESKGGRPRLVPLSTRAKLCLTGLLREVDPASLSQDKLVKAWDKLRTKAGIDSAYTMYSTRHTFAVRMLEAGVDLFTLADLMGHSKIETTRIYAHVTGTLKAEAVRRVEVASAVSAGVTESVPEVAEPGVDRSPKSLIGKANDLPPNRIPSINSPSLYRLSYQGIDLQIRGLTAYSTPPKP